ncbi:hypothetical protein BGZ81_000806, partial [Podila clonocystis]
GMAQGGVRHDHSSGTQTMASLARHYSTLDEISIMQTLGSAHVTRFLVLCPKLEKLVVID